MCSVLLTFQPRPSDSLEEPSWHAPCSTRSNSRLLGALMKTYDRTFSTELVRSAAGILAAVALTAGLGWAMAMDLQRTFEAPAAPRHRTGIVIVESGAGEACALSAAEGPQVGPKVAAR